MKRFSSFFMLFLCSIMLVACTSTDVSSTRATKDDGSAQTEVSEDTDNVVIYNKFSENTIEDISYTMVSTITLSYNQDNVNTQTNIYIATPDNDSTTSEDIKSNLKETILGSNVDDIKGITYGFDSQEKDVILTIKIDYKTLDFEKFQQTNLYLVGDSANNVVIDECKKKLEEEGFVKRGV